MTMTTITTKTNMSKALEQLLDNCNYFSEILCRALIVLDDQLQHLLNNDQTFQITDIELLASKFIEIKSYMYFKYLASYDEQMAIKITAYETFFTDQFNQHIANKNNSSFNIAQTLKVSKNIRHE